MRIKAVMRAGENEKFMSNAFDNQIGKTMPVNWPGGTAQGTIEKAEVMDNGTAVLLTINVEASDG